MAAELGMSTPDLHVVDDEGANAFALGTRWDGVIVVHAGLFNLLDDEDEMAAILGHELAHLYYCDSLLTGVGRAVERFIRRIGRVIALVVLTIVTLGLVWVTARTEREARVSRAIESILAAPIVLSQNALSRYREFVADRTSAMLLGDATPMIAALTELEDAASDDTDRLSPVNPVDRSRRLFHTHPSLDRRQRLLRDDFERERDEFVPFYEGATLGPFTKFGLIVAPFLSSHCSSGESSNRLECSPSPSRTPGPGSHLRPSSSSCSGSRASARSLGRCCSRPVDGRCSASPSWAVWRWRSLRAPSGGCSPPWRRSMRSQRLATSG